MKSCMECTPALRAKFPLFAFLVLLVLGGCSDPATLGLELAPENNQIGVFYKEIPLDAQVVLLDSFNTTNAGILIVGDEQDSYFGKTRSLAYTRLHIEQGSERPRSDALLDSVFFNLSAVSVNGTDLDKKKEYAVHLLSQPLMDTLYYNFSKLPYQANPIAQVEIIFKNTKDTLLKAPLNSVVAGEMFGKLKRGIEFDNLFSFRKYLPGVAIVPREGDNTTAGFSLGNNTGITFFYHYTGDTTVKKYSITTLSSRSFNGIESDRRGTPTEVVRDYQRSYSTGATVGMKSGLGLAIRLDTSPLDAFLDTLKGVVFNQVTLQLGPIEEQDKGQTPISGMVMKFIDSKNRVFLSSINKAELHLQGDGQIQVIEDEKGKKVPNNFFPSSSLLGYEPAAKLQRAGISSYMNSLYKKELQRKDWLLYAITPSTGDDFNRSMRQFKVKKDKVVVTVIYSKSK
ncbi:MAG: DUF4270 family protein [Bacteroidetes bacterium]|nr:DUF4270 family protein [Bacteroidota bacterium]